MKVAFITLHRVRNYGSSLQTLALQKILEKKGQEPLVIDYYPERYSSFGLLKRLKNKSIHLKKNIILLTIARLIISVSYVKKKIVFDGFLHKHLKTTDRVYHSEEELERDVPAADVYCTGSDQVWNSHWNEGLDWPFYLKFLKGDEFRFSYASSFGNSEIAKEETSAIRPYLEKYAFLSSRENAGKDILKKMGFKDAQQTLDPTLLLTPEDWEPYVSDRYRNKKYVFNYNLHHDPMVDRYAGLIAQKHGLEVYNISYNLHDLTRKGKLIWCPKVEDYLGLIKYAQYVVTDSFHATVFSLIFHRKFMVLCPEQAGSRVRSLTSLVRMPERCASGWTDTGIIEQEIDYTEVDKILAKERKFSLDYLQLVLEYAERSKKAGKVVDKQSVLAKLNAMTANEAMSVADNQNREDPSRRLSADKSKCCGCGACMNVCPRDAIVMLPDAYGALYPVIDMDKCIECGLCEKVCAFRNKEEDSRPLKVYAATSKNMEQKLDSASGGIFAAIASKELANGAVVYGSAYDADYKVVHIGIDSPEQLRALQGSKYVQSDTGRTFSEVKQRLEKGEKVLYSGTPCQIAGLKSFLGTDYENLITVDIICHGVPGSRLFADFLTNLKNQYGDYSNFTFRDKRICWGLNGSIKLADGSMQKLFGSEYAYYWYFLHADIYRENCYHCKYACSARPADITIGDYWGIEKAHPGLLGKGIWKEENGISVIICNSEKGCTYVEGLRDVVEMIPSDFKKASEKNHQLRHPSIVSDRRERVMAIYCTEGYEELDRYYRERMGWRVWTDRIKSLIPIPVKRILKRMK